MITITEVQKSPILFDKFIEENLGLVWAVLHRHYSQVFTTGESEDYFQVGCIGLIKAARMYNPDFGNSFSTYATPMIWGEIARYRRDFSTSSVKTTRKCKELYFRVTALREEGYSDTEICSELKINMKTLKKVPYNIKTLSLSEPIDDEGKILLQDSLSSCDNCQTVIEEISLKEKLAALKQALCDTDYQILLMYIQGKTQLYIADKFGFSQVNISRIISHIKKVLKQINKDFEMGKKTTIQKRKRSVKVPA